MAKTILITGATGMIGGHIISELLWRGDRYIALTTNTASAEKKLTQPYRIIASKDVLSLKDENIDAIINLAGANLGEKRWNDKTKKVFYDSRIQVTGGLVELISKMEKKPEVLVSSSGVDYYGDTGNRDMFEDAPPAKSFLGKLTHDWEAAALKAEQHGTRVVVLRTGFVMAGDSEAVKKLIMPFKFFVGGPLGSGKQYISWIHISDLTGIYMFAIDNKNVSGIYNAAAPNPETNYDFGRQAAKILHRPAIAPAPAFMIKLIVGEMAAVVLEGRRALPKKMMDAGYRFKFEHAIDAWKDILK
ncbi:MAG: TIGR01777 family oxidoreductase [Ignavibacteria bacterium]